jgi:hypothetical protein
VQSYKEYTEKAVTGFRDTRVFLEELAPFLNRRQGREVAEAAYRKEWDKVVKIVDDDPEEALEQLVQLDSRLHFPVCSHDHPATTGTEKPKEP